jgi:hypothetical protein
MIREVLALETPHLDEVGQPASAAHGVFVVLPLEAKVKRHPTDACVSHDRSILKDRELEGFACWHV